MESVLELREEAKESLKRIQEFDPNTLIQAEKFGQKDFRNAVEPARRLIELFCQLPVETLDFFPEKELDTVKRGSNSLYQILGIIYLTKQPPIHILGSGGY